MWRPSTVTVPVSFSRSRAALRSSCVCAWFVLYAWLQVLQRLPPISLCVCDDCVSLAARMVVFLHQFLQHRSLFGWFFVQPAQERYSARQFTFHPLHSLAGVLPITLLHYVIEYFMYMMAAVCTCCLKPLICLTYSTKARAATFYLNL